MDYSVSMAIVDFIPVILFAVSAIILQRDFYCRMSKGAFAIFRAGTIDIICAGTLKALYKLLYRAGICDFTRLNELFFPLQSIGFMLAGLGIIAMTFHRQGEPHKEFAAAAAAPAKYSGTMIFVIMMCLGLAMMDFPLAAMAKKAGRMKTAVMFIVSFVCSLGMGYLSSRDVTSRAVNWIAEATNIAGQLLMLIAVISMHRAMKKPEQEVR